MAKELSPKGSPAARGKGAVTASSSGAQPPSGSTARATLPRPAPLAFPLLTLLGTLLLLSALLFPWTTLSVSATQTSGSGFFDATASFDTFAICFSESTNFQNASLVSPTSPTLHASPAIVVENGNSNGSSSGSNNSSGGPSFLTPGQCTDYSALSSAGNGLSSVAYILTVLSVLHLLAITLGTVGTILGMRTGVAPATRKSLRRPYSYSRSGAVVGLVSGIGLFLVLTIIIGFLAGSVCSGGNGGGAFVFSAAGSCHLDPDHGSGNGSGSSANVTGTVSWAPSMAFYFDLAGFALLLIGALGLRSYWKREEPPAALAVPGGAAASDEVAQLRQELEAIKAQMATKGGTPSEGSPSALPATPPPAGGSAKPPKPED